MIRILVFANSIKMQARCIAGREVRAGGGRLRLGDWVRPVSVIGRGELLRHYYTFEEGGHAEVMDIVEVPLVQRKDDPGQPENWLVDRDARWAKVGRVDRRCVAPWTESPDDLWLEADDQPDRISAEGQRQRDRQSSLVLIEPRNLRIRTWQQYNRWRAETEVKARAVFEYKGQEYALSITDPIIREQVAAGRAQNDRKAVEQRLPFGDRCRLCISLTPPFEGFHFKVVATILELP